MWCSLSLDDRKGNVLICEPLSAWLASIQNLDVALEGVFLHEVSQHDLFLSL